MNRRFRLFLVFSCSVALAGMGCHRNVEPYDPEEKVAEPDLSRIFPEGADRSQDSGPGPIAGGGPSPSPAPPAAPASSRGTESDAKPIQGTIELADELKDKIPPGAILFLIARTGPGGPPTAVQRIVDPSFPLDFELGPKDRMIQAMPFAGPFTVTARVDADQNAMTKNPGDLSGAAEGTHLPGATGITLLINELQ